jgi:hypothetical protein
MYQKRKKVSRDVKTCSGCRSLFSLHAYLCAGVRSEFQACVVSSLSHIDLLVALNMTCCTVREKILESCKLQCWGYELDHSKSLESHAVGTGDSGAVATT